MTLPIHAVLPELTATLASTPNAVLVAPPGAGKTTVVPLALLDQPWAEGRIVVLEPRRLAARAAARRMAQTLGEAVGATVGYRVRGDSRVSARTRVEVVTEGVFTRLILDDPALEGISAVLFDEFHERSLDADLGLAFALDAQSVLRPDLRLLVMSATLDGARVAGLLGPGDQPAPLVRSEGRAFPIETRHLGRDPALPTEDQVSRAVRQALADEPGSLLVFLPGQAEIRRVERQLAERLPSDAILAPLYGALTPAEQDRAVDPAPSGRRKVVLATSIAETSLTIEGVRGVVDSGLSREPRFDPASGLTRLVTVRVSQAAADQRRGRAGRTQPGVCWRLWSEPETRALRPFSRPEILDSDLSRLALDLAGWGARDATALAFLDPPPPAALAEARAVLQRIDALDGEGTLTPHGRTIARLPLPPRLAHMVVRGAESGAAHLAASVAAVVSERGLGGDDPDLHTRLDRLRRDASSRARDARALAQRWADLAGGCSNSRSPREPPGGGAGQEGRPTQHPSTPAHLLALAYPERIAKARGAPGEYRLASGRGAHLDPAHPLSRHPWLAVGELGGGGARDRILLAAPLDPDRIAADFADQLTTAETLDADAAGRLRARRIIRLGRLEVATQTIPADPALIRRVLLDRVRTDGLAALPPSEALDKLRARVSFLRQAAGQEAWPDLSEAVLLARVEDWLEPLLEGRTSLAQVPPPELAEAVAGLLPWERRRELDRLAPTHFEAPTGSRLPIDYKAEGGPEVAVRVQELFGLAAHPRVAGVPLRLVLLSPAHRPIQTTADLPGFWRGSWGAVRAEMRGRYPRHPWPEDPAAAPPTTRAKPRS
ncbi:MAG: ATP-dependent helicase HrpB [Proteobacteria bacterium]|nr:ATP-dependent helicase HrpB [Pseudomonadota bacterium]